jgi:hypothetical protein
MLGRFFRDRLKENDDHKKDDQVISDEHVIDIDDRSVKGCGRMSMSDIINKIVSAIVDYPDDVKINTIDGGRTTIIELKVAKDDIGKVIGKQGRTISAIRSLLASAGGKEKIRYVLALFED